MYFLIPTLLIPIKSLFELLVQGVVLIGMNIPFAEVIYPFFFSRFSKKKLFKSNETIKISTDRLMLHPVRDQTIKQKRQNNQKLEFAVQV